VPSPLKGMGTPGQQGPPQAPIAPGVTTRSTSAALMKREELAAHAASDFGAMGDNAANAAAHANLQMLEMQRELEQLRLEKQTRLRQEAQIHQQQQQAQQQRQLAPQQQQQQQRQQQ